MKLCKIICPSIVIGAFILFNLSFLSCVAVGQSLIENIKQSHNGVTEKNIILMMPPILAGVQKNNNFNKGEDVIVTGQIMTPSGGQIIVNAPGTPIHGIKVLFPQGAVSKNIAVKIGYNTGSLHAKSGDYSNVNLVIQTPGVTILNKPITVTVPYIDSTGDGIVIPYNIAEDQSLSSVQLHSIDRANKRVSFITYHPSTYTWIVDSYENSKDVDTGFRPTADGFKVANQDSFYERGGECMGMAVFSFWYYKYKMKKEGHLFNKFNNIIGSDAAGNPLNGQDIIATRAHIATHHYIADYWKLFDRQTYGGEYLYTFIMNTINQTGFPIILGLSKVYGGSDAHALVVYGVDDEKGHVLVYDPNYPGEKRFLVFNKSQKKFESYMGESKIAPFSYGTIFAQSDLERILLDAKRNFYSSTMPMIHISYPDNNATIDSFTTTINGTITSAEVLVEELLIYNGNNKYTAHVNLDGSFSANVALKKGNNHLFFETRGRNSDNTSIKITPTNMDTQRYSLYVDAPSAAILMTLTWDTNDTDLDIYVIDPTGDYSSYYHKTTSDGGELDLDDVDGYGPEHWTLMDSDIKRYGQPYRFRVHYYDDKGHGATNYRVTITVHQGTSSEKNYFYTGYLDVSNVINDDPTSIGNDWKDVAYISLDRLSSSSFVVEDGIDNQVLFEIH